MNSEINCYNQNKDALTKKEVTFGDYTDCLLYTLDVGKF